MPEFIFSLIIILNFGLFLRLGRHQPDFDSFEGGDYYEFAEGDGETGYALADQLVGGG